ncbi:hypothetical protein QFZ37_003672 [Chryseobacterium ginsenosidimutans]|uniref:T6SS phospholipase effector Tle1-like catalytic domain-containing protein n=1 Tax=Chryseobacterium ginsenosidimutans TaxID=687846 RepID=UPI0027826DFA|nr:DUF2235 domain-containing protein [Chryseobacterium ginsenosidimutans]MDQ0595303.1 hypothetical protein [Chryseobacterium ginsenosidimutans]
MSIEYFVEGKAITQTGGDYKTFAKEGISHNSAATVEQKGKETGVNYNKAQTINPNDKPVNTIDVKLNLFFDGTLNNKTNTQAGPKHESSNGNDSYANDFSNVAKGYDAIDPNAENQVAYYVEGIGTVDLKSDNDTLGLPIRGAGLGTSERGIKAKVTKGCLKAAEFIKNKFNKKEIDTLTVNVYGFSRGAAAARHFVHVATSTARMETLYKNQVLVYPPEDYEKSDSEESEQQMFVLENGDAPLLKYGYFGACLEKNALIIKNVRFNFIGLYDTVASYGANHKGTSIFGLSIIDDDSKQLGLNSVKNGAFVLQLASSDEFRDNFSLTNIESAGIKGLNLTLPGVHSDIGGGYVKDAEEKVLLYKHESSKTECETFREMLIDEGWFRPKEIWIETERPHVHDVDPQYKLWGKRNVSNEYDKVSLYHMYEFSKQFSVIYDGNITARHKINDSFIEKINHQITASYIMKCNNLRNQYIKDHNDGKKPVESQYINECKEYSYLESNIEAEDLKKLRNLYLHWSANLDKFGMSPRITGVKPASERKRYILNG